MKYQLEARDKFSNEVLLRILVLAITFLWVDQIQFTKKEIRVQLFQMTLEAFDVYYDEEMISIFEGISIDDASQWAYKTVKNGQKFCSVS